MSPLVGLVLVSPSSGFCRPSTWPASSYSNTSVWGSRPTTPENPPSALVAVASRKVVVTSLPSGLVAIAESETFPLPCSEPVPSPVGIASEVNSTCQSIGSPNTSVAVISIRWSPASRPAPTRWPGWIGSPSSV